jgi:ACS family glucarate transporter-like MFS transporter
MPSKPRPTNVRYLIVVVAGMMAFFLYLHRGYLSFAEVYIKQDLDLTDDQIGWLLSAFSWAYALAQVPAGWLGDRWGVRPMLTLYIFLWSVCTGFMGLAGGFAAVIALRLGCGLAQAGAFPTSGRLLSRWVPFSARALASAVVSIGGRLGGAVAPILTAYLLVTFVGEDTPTRLSPDDLTAVPQFCQRLLPSDKQDPAGIGKRVLAALPQNAIAVVESSVASPVTEDDRVILTAGLNEILDQRDFVQPADLKELPLSAEAKKLAERDRSTLSETQVRRLNRLVLEAAFPQNVKKLYALGWRTVVLVYGTAGVVMALVFWLCFRDRPDEHPLCNREEQALIATGPSAAASVAKAAAGGIPLLALTKNFSLWMSSICQFGTNFGWIFLMSWLPRYLDEVHHVPIGERSWLSSVPLFVGIVGMLLGGWLTDRLTRRLGLRWGRCLPLSLSRFVAMAAFVCAAVLDSTWGSAWAATLAFMVVALATDLGTPAIWAYNQDVGGRYVGSVLGWGNMWGNIGAALSAKILPDVRDKYGWSVMFLVFAAAFLISGVSALGIDASSQIVPEAKRS